jgi:hypothetical protein
MEDHRIGAGIRGTAPPAGHAADVVGLERDIGRRLDAAHDGIEGSTRGDTTHLALHWKNHLTQAGHDNGICRCQGMSCCPRGNKRRIFGKVHGISPRVSSWQSKEWRR